MQPLSGSQWLVIGDINTEAVEFNRFLIRLLAKIERYEDFRAIVSSLATEESYNDVLEDLASKGIANVRKIISADDVDYLRAKEDNGVNYGYAPRIEALVREITEYSELWAKPLYEKLHVTASQGHIVSLQFDIGAVSAWKALKEELKLKWLYLSLVDVSNAWWSEYSGEKSLSEIFQVLSEDAKTGFMFLLTNIADQKSMGSKQMIWNYFVFSISPYSAPRVQAFFDHFSNFRSRFAAPDEYTYNYGANDTSKTQVFGAEELATALVTKGIHLNAHVYRFNELIP